jgi:hypothetical protein
MRELHKQKQQYDTQLKNATTSMNNRMCAMKQSILAEKQKGEMQKELIK